MRNPWYHFRHFSITLFVLGIHESRVGTTILMDTQDTEFYQIVLKVMQTKKLTTLTNLDLSNIVTIFKVKT